MSDPSGSRGFLRDWLPHLMTVVGLIFAGGQAYSRDTDRERRVEKLEGRVDRGDDKFAEIGRAIERVDGKVERVDAKLSLVIERLPDRH